MNHKLIRLTRYTPVKENNSDKHVWISIQYIESIAETTHNEGKAVTVVKMLFGNSEYWVTETADEIYGKIVKLG